MQGTEERRLRRMSNTPQGGVIEGNAADDAFLVDLDEKGEGKPNLPPLYRFVVHKNGLLSGFQVPPIRHVHKDPFPGFVYTEGLSLFVNMRNHQLSDFMGICRESPFPQSHLL